MAILVVTESQCHSYAQACHKNVSAHLLLFNAATCEKKGAQIITVRIVPPEAGSKLLQRSDTMKYAGTLGFIIVYSEWSWQLANKWVMRERMVGRFELSKVLVPEEILT